jgi:Flp pilus assembly protein TadD
LHQAEQVFRRILDSAPDHPEVLHALGTLLIQKGDAARALPLLRRAADLRPGVAGGWNNLASALNALARHAEAEAAADPGRPAGRELWPVGGLAGWAGGDGAGG